ncbi:uncharacterized protein LOC144102047 [Amblyomma americanum]
MPNRRRQHHCFAPGCDTGYKWAQGEQPSLFAVPKDEGKRKVWERNLHRKDKVLDESCSVCERHFDPSCILRDYVHIIEGKEVRIPRGKPELLPDAVPTLLPNTPGYLSKKTPTPRAPRKRKSPTVCSADPKRPCTEQNSHNDAVKELASLDTPYLQGDALEPQLFEATSVLGLRSLDVPSVYWSSHNVPGHNGFVYCKLIMCKSEEVVCERAVIFTEHDGPEVKYTAHLYGSIVEKGTILSREQAADVLFRTDSHRVCLGALPTSQMPKSNLTEGLEQQVTIRNGAYYSKKCAGKEQSEGQACISCRYTRKALQSRKSRLKGLIRKRTRTTAARLRAAAQKNRRLFSRCARLKDRLKQMQEENSLKPEEVLQEQIASLPLKQQDCVRQCFSAAKKKSAKGNVYSKDWILECILMKMKSAKLYEHLRKHNILSLPSKSTLKRYLKLYKSGFGFSTKILRQLKQKTRHMSTFSRRGGLLVDELKLSEHLNVTSSGHIEGFVDMGSFTEGGESVPCDHGMVVMFIPFTGKWTQIIGCFATRGNAKAELLAKIIIEATVLAEASGLLVDFITSDGASWNRRMWKILGIGVESGKVTCKSEHPVDPARHLHFLSDFPHLLKCVRNTLLSHPLNTPNGMVSIQPLRQAFRIDSGNITLKAMPGLTLVHLQPNGFEKMRVTLAFQLFGDRVLNGLNFYKDTLESSWGKIDATLSFFT